MQRMHCVAKNRTRPYWRELYETEKPSWNAQPSAEAFTEAHNDAVFWRTAYFRVQSKYMKVKYVQDKE